MLLLYLLSSLLTFFVPMGLTIKALDKATPAATPVQSYQFLLNYWLYYAAVAHITHTYTDRSDSILLAATAFRLWLFYGQSNNVAATNAMITTRVLGGKDLAAFEQTWVDPLLRQYVVPGSRTANMSVLQYCLYHLADKHEPSGDAKTWPLSHPMRWISRAVSAGAARGDPESAISSTPSRKRSAKKAVAIRKSASNHSLRSLTAAAGSVSPRRRSHRSSDPPYPSQAFGEIPQVEHAIVDDIMDEMIQQPEAMGVYDDYFNNSYPEPVQAPPQHPAPAPPPVQAPAPAPAPPQNQHQHQHQHHYSHAGGIPPPGPGPAAPPEPRSYKINTGFFNQNKHKLFPKRDTKPLPMAP